MDEKEISEKVRYFAGGESRERVDRVIEMILDMEKIHSIKELTGLI